MLHLHLMGPLKCSLLSFSKFKTLGSSHFWSCPFLPRLCFFYRSRSSQHCDFLLRLFQLVYLHCSIWCHCANATLPPHPCLQTFYPSSAHFVSSSAVPSPPPNAPGCFYTPPASFSLLTPSGFFNGMLGVSKPGTLNYYTI